MGKLLALLPLPLAAVVAALYLFLGDGPFPVIFRTSLGIVSGQSEASATAVASTGNVLAAALIFLTPVVFTAAVVWGLIKR
jgi:hypothetical protein